MQNTIYLLEWFHTLPPMAAHGCHYRMCGQPARSLDHSLIFQWYLEQRENIYCLKGRAETVPQDTGLFSMGRAAWRLLSLTSTYATASSLLLRLLSLCQV